MAWKRRGRCSNDGASRRAVSDPSAWERATACAHLRWCMAHSAGLGDALRCVHLPLRRSCLHQHHSRRGASLSQRRPRRPHDGASARVLRPIPLLVEIRLLDADALPVGLELFRDEHRDRGSRALPHLRPRYDDKDLAARLDAQERVRRERLRGPRAAAWREANADGQTAERGESDREEFATTDSTCFHGRHCGLRRQARS